MSERGSPCPVCVREHSLAQSSDPPPRLVWIRAYGGAVGQTVTRWSGGMWRCPVCELALTPRDMEMLAPAWTPGPPTEPGEWWLTVEMDGHRYVSVQHGRTALPDRYILAHAPLLRPEPWRG